MRVPTINLVCLATGIILAGVLNLLSAKQIKANEAESSFYKQYSDHPYCTKTLTGNNEVPEKLYHSNKETK